MLYPLSQLPVGVQFTLKKNTHLSDTSDSHSSDCKDYSFLRCDPVRFGSQLPTTEDSWFQASTTKLMQYVCGATQKFGEFKQGARTGCRMPFCR